MRIVKEHSERLEEILDTAQRLFSEKGYGKCTINDIINEIGIAKGTFYHYFKSKEEVLNAINDRITAKILERVRAVSRDETLSSENKLLKIFLSLNASEEIEEGLVEEMHEPENALLHQKMLASAVALVSPVLADVVKEGIEKGDFVCEYPEEYMQIFLTSAMTLSDGGIFQLEKEKQQKLFCALISLLAKMLGRDENDFLEKVKGHWIN